MKNKIRAVINNIEMIEAIMIGVNIVNLVYRLFEK